MEWTTVAELRTDVHEWHCQSVKLAGRSGPSGDDQRSGLYDNLVVWSHSDDHGMLMYNVPFDQLEGWFELYGDPSPHILADFGNPSPCLMTAGDSLCSSGVYGPYSSLVGQFVLEFFVDVYVGSTADFHEVEFGVALDSAPSGPPGQEVLEHVIGVTWTNNLQGANVLQCVTELDCLEVPAEQWVAGWHTVGFYWLCSSPVEASSWTRIKAMFQ